MTSAPEPAASSARAARPALAPTALFVAVFAALVGGTPRIDNDVYWHLSIGREIVHHGVPETDPLSFSTGEVAWSPPEWLGELSMFGLDAALGLEGLALARLVVLAMLAALLFARARGLGAAPWAAVIVLAVASIPASVHLPMRPLLAGHLFCALLLLELDRHRRGERSLVAYAPLLFALWANVHPSWPLGLALLGLSTFADVVLPGLSPGALRRLGMKEAALAPAGQKRLGLAFALSIPAPLLGPSPIGRALYPFVHLVGLGDQAGEIIEWFPLSPTEPLHLLTLLGVALVLVRLWRTRAERGAFELFAVLFSAALAIRYQRFLPLVSIVAGPILAALWPLPLWASPPRLVSRLGALAAAALLALALPLPAELSREERETYPVAAATWLAAHPAPERVFCTFEHGGYLGWTLPERRVYIDSRFDPYARTGVFLEYLALRRGERVLETFEARGISGAVVPRPEVDENFVAMRAVLDGAGWREVAGDEVAALLVAPPGSGASE